MVGPPEERMIWGENSPEALWAYRMREWHNQRRKTNTLMKNNQRPTPTYGLRHLI